MIMPLPRTYQQTALITPQLFSTARGLNGSLPPLPAPPYFTPLGFYRALGGAPSQLADFQQMQSLYLYS